MSTASDIPSSILILGSGVFGLSTAYSLATNDTYKDTKITVVDRSTFPAPDGSSIDTSRIVRADYGDLAYAKLALEAQERWRNEWWGENDVYHETGLALLTESHGHGASMSEADQSYMLKSLKNVQQCGLTVGTKAGGQALEILPTKSAIASLIAQPTSTHGDACTADYGYVNWRSGWADAEGGMRNLHAKLSALNRVTFITASVTRLLFSSNTVTGAHLSNNTTLTADLTILATGAWTPSLIDLRGIASATGQPIVYAPLTPAEQASLAPNPTILNESSGMFIIPPSHNLLKIARHCYGYANPVTIPNPEPSQNEAEITVSLPLTQWDDPNPKLPREAVDECRAFLRQTFPELGDREFSMQRICWYTDTATGDWIVDHHPRYKGLFVATGGSGHAYKFLPVVGEKIVQCIEGRRPEVFDKKWKFPTRVEKDHMWTDDWRGGKKGMVLSEEMERHGDNGV